MKPLIDNDAASQQARNWSSQLGTLAAEKAPTSSAPPTRLSTILNHFRRQSRAREHVQPSINAHHFIMGD